MTLEKGQPLKDFGQIQSCQTYLNNETEKNLKQKKLVFNKHFVEGEEYCVVNRKVNGGYICFCETKNSERIYFYHLLFDSLIGRFLLDNSVLTNGFKGQVTLKQLREFPVIIPSDDVLRAGISLDHSIETIIDLAHKDNDELFLESAKNLMEELRDDFVLELYFKDLFISHNISIVGSLVDVVNNCEGTSFTQTVLQIMRAITTPKEALLSNMRRFRVLLSSFKHQSSR